MGNLQHKLQKNKKLSYNTLTSYFNELKEVAPNVCDLTFTKGEWHISFINLDLMFTIDEYHESEEIYKILKELNWYYGGE
jgi:hypothetical protein